MSKKTEALLVEKEQSWGNPSFTHERIAEVWTGILGVSIDSTRVALMMTGLKLVRAAINPSDRDSFDDASGYAWIAAICEGHETWRTDNEPV